jgi:hypothetical protein
MELQFKIVGVYIVSSCIYLFASQALLQAIGSEMS